MPTEFIRARQELPSSPLQLRDFPSSVERSNANIRPNFDRSVGSNANTIYPQGPDLPIQRLVKPSTPPPADRIKEIEREVTESLRLANDAPTVFEKTKDLPASPKLKQLRTKIQDLAEQLRRAQAELETEENKPTALQVFVDSALQLERSVQFLSGNLLVALTDRALEETFKVSREDAEPAVVKTISKRWKRLSNYQAFMSVHRALQDHRVSELLIQNAIKRSSAALAVIADVLKENK
jgi:hypothetical protein